MRRQIFTEEHDAFRDMVRAFIAKEITPYHEQWERDGIVSRDVWLAAGRAGLLGIHLDEKYGGGGQPDYRFYVVLNEELARAGASGPMFQLHNDMIGPYLDRLCSPEQRDRWFPGYCSGELIAAIAMTEPGAGSDLQGIRTTAVRHGDRYVLNGQKTFISNGQLADIVIVVARTDPDAAHRGISLLMVERGMPGFTRGRNLDKLGMHAQDTSELSFTDVAVPAANLLGEEGLGFYSIMRNFQNERIAIGSMAIGESAKALEITLEYVKTRKAFGAPLWDKQAIRQRLAMLAAKVEAGRQLVWHAASLDAAGQDCVKEVSMVKAYCGELVNEVMYDCLQFHGGAGYLRESAIERMTRDARVQSIGGGATEVMLEEVAKRL